MDEQFVQEIVALVRNSAERNNDVLSHAQMRTRFSCRLDALYSAYSDTSLPEAGVYAVAADCLADAALCWSTGDEWPYWHLVALLHYFDLGMAKTKAAALAKYRYRASGPNVNILDIERNLIEEAINE